ncbi:TPA: hypothetical protein ACGD69_004057 [Serratia marcescens]|uniref:hypothetical protein n=1 Tax=Serratia TaxID=613 RepID=UPI00114E84D7|nr:MULTISPECIES: hypothetical protein [Serratia]QDI12528.1 hypothetical protein FBF84_04865 [Serratia marcescens]QDI22271.1 hypothetical protein FBF90_04865 [Serratia marcescens]TXE47861.1 hypothetical protein FOT55_15020 [Serratia bockelmannii]CAE7748967.1 hypothetical protein AI2795V1_1041 [Serratia marcescens]CAH3556318.1 hypothetical protein AI2795V1_1041 [Serratia marcescens]
MSDQSNRGKSPQEVVNNAIKQFEGLKKGDPVKRPGWYYLDALEAEENAVIVDGKRVIRRNDDDGSS